MVDRKMYSRSRQKAFLNRVVDEELYKPEAPHGLRRTDRGISELFVPERHAPSAGQPRNRVAGFMEPSPRPSPGIVRQARRVPRQVPVAPAAKPEGYLARLWRRLGSLVPGIWT